MSDLSNAALLVMDYQPTILGIAQDADGLIAKAKTVIAAARAKGLPVIYIQVGFRPGHPEISPRNPMFSGIKAAGRLTLDNPGTDIDPRVGRLDDEMVFTKPRVNAFHGTQLETVLRAKGVDTLILMGVSTSGVVLSTTRHAADADYGVFIVSDACADGDPEVHKVLTEKVFPRQATVLSAEDMVAKLA